jgi:hypothetical protein
MDGVRLVSFSQNKTLEQSLQCPHSSYPHSYSSSDLLFSMSLCVWCLGSSWNPLPCVGFQPSPSQRKSKEKQKQKEKKKSCGPKFLINTWKLKKRKKEANTKGTKSQNARQFFFWGGGWLVIKERKKTCLKLRNQIATQKKPRKDYSNCVMAPIMYRSGCGDDTRFFFSCLFLKKEKRQRFPQMPIIFTVPLFITIPDRIFALLYGAVIYRRQLIGWPTFCILPYHSHHEKTNN